MFARAILAVGFWMIASAAFGQSRCDCSVIVDQCRAQVSPFSMEDKVTNRTTERIIGLRREGVAHGSAKHLQDFSISSALSCSHAV